MIEIQYVLLIVVGVLIIIFLIYGDRINKPTIEFFGDYDIAKRNTYTDTFYEYSLRTAFTDYPRFICNILPISREDDCKDINGSPYTRSLHPVHIIKLQSGEYLAVFNDGLIYTKDSMSNKFWSGPLALSMPEDSQPLRMITLTADGTLLGVAYNNKLYKKTPPTRTNVIGYKRFETRWQLVPKSNNIIYIMYKSDIASSATNTTADILVGINTSGMLVKKNASNMATEDFTALTNERFPVFKIFFDKNDFMLGIGGDFKLYKKTTTDWTTSSFDLLEGGNPTLINDIIYDNDGKLFGLVMLPVIGILELQKQQQTYYLSAFIPMELMSTANSQDLQTSIISDLDIIKYKTGANVSNLVGVADPLLLDNSADVISKLIDIENESKLREFCIGKGYLSKSEFQNYELLNQIDDQKNKISTLNDVLTNLTKYNSDTAKIQEFNPANMSL
jgi:hypothetical protein